MHNRTITSCAGAAFVVSAVLFISPASDAKSFKAKLYPDCYAGVSNVAPLVTPEENMTEKAGKIGGFLGKVGGFAGLGGSAGTALKAADTANKINKYSGIIEDVMGFSAQMTTDHPDPNDRFAAYGDHMSKEAEDLVKVNDAVMASQSCYQAAFDALAADVAAGTLKKSKTKKQVTEIQQGVQASGDVLILALDRVNKNVQSYDQALAGENASMTALGFNQPAATTGLGGFGTLSSLAGFAGVNRSGSAMVATAVADQVIQQGDTAVEPAATAPKEAAGLATLAHSSQQYLDLYTQVRETAEIQRQLELTVNKGL